MQMSYEHAQKIIHKELQSKNIASALQDALTIAANALSLQIEKEAIIDYSNMDEDFCDWLYICPTCNMSQNDDNERIGRCDCGQLLFFKPFTEWKETFVKSYHWSNNLHCWTNKGPKTTKGVR